MANRLYHPPIPRRPKERPFNDEDTRIQIREDYVQRYMREPIWRKAKEERVINWSLTSPMLLDMETHNEDDDVGVRTRERHLPQTPTQLEFLAGIKDAQAPLQTRDLEMTLRYINDSIRWDAEFTKIFILGILRQLRYWVQGHNPKKLQQQGMSALLYVRDDFLPKLTTDMSVLQNYWNPDHDLEELRRWELELDNLIREINTRIFQSTKNSSSQDGASLNTAQDDSPNENQSTNEKSQDETLGVNVRNENLDENEEIALRLLLSEPESESGLDSVLGLFEPQEKKEEDSKPIQLSSESSEFWEQVLEEASDPLATCRNIIGGAGSDMSIQLGRILESALDEDPKTFGGKDGVEFIKSLSVWIELGEAIPLQQLQEHSSFEKITEYLYNRLEQDKYQLQRMFTVSITFSDTEEEEDISHQEKSKKKTSKTKKTKKEKTKNTKSKKSKLKKNSTSKASQKGKNNN